MNSGSMVGGGVLAGYLAILAFTFIFSIVLYVVSAYFMSKVFDKAGVDGRWRAWVPGYNMMVFLKLGDLSPWLVLYCAGGLILLSWLGIGFLFSIALFVVSVMASYRIGQKLGAEPALVALWLIPVAWLVVMAQKNASWNSHIEPSPWAGNGFLEDRTRWEGVPSQAVLSGDGDSAHGVVAA